MLASIAIALLAITTWQATGSTGRDAAAEAAIRAIVADQASAWSAGDGKRNATRVAPDVSFTNLFGMVIYGAPAFEARHSEILSAFYKGTTKKHVVRRIRFITPDAQSWTSTMKCMASGRCPQASTCRKMVGSRHS